jgi:hypothetical protein
VLFMRRTIQIIASFLLFSAGAIWAALDVIGRAATAMDIVLWVPDWVKRLSAHQELGWQLAPWTFMALGVLSVALIQVPTEWFVFWRKKEEDSYLPIPDTDLSMAVWAMSRTSAWAKWYRARNLADTAMPINERSFMNIVAHVIGEEAVKGNLAIRGRSFDSKDWEAIKREDWHIAYLDIHPNAGQVGALWQVKIRPRFGINAEVIGKLFDYDNRLMVDSAQFQKLWPRRDPTLDATRKQLLKKAKAAGADLDEIERLNTP